MPTTHHTHIHSAPTQAPPQLCLAKQAIDFSKDVLQTWLVWNEGKGMLSLGKAKISARFVVFILPDLTG